LGALLLVNCEALRAQSADASKDVNWGAEPPSVPAEPASAPAEPASAPDPAPAPAPAESAPAPASVEPVSAAAPTPVPSTAPASSAEAGVPAPEAVNAATYTRQIAQLYEDLAEDAKAFTAKGHADIAALKAKEAAIQAKLDAVNQEFDAKSKDPEVKKKTSWLGGNKELRALKKQAKGFRSDLSKAVIGTRRRTALLVDQMWEMHKRHLDAVEVRYREVEKFLKAAQ